MLELALLSLLNRLMNWGTAPVIATRTVVADAPTLHDLLRDEREQARLVAGISPLARPYAQPIPGSNPRFLHARVLLGRHELLWITWLLTPNHGTTDVDLAAQAASRRMPARLLALAGRRWLRRRLRTVLAGVAADARAVAEGVDAGAGTDVVVCTGVAA